MNFFKRSPPSLCDMIKLRKIKSLEQLQSYVDEINSRDEDGNTPLILFCKYYYPIYHSSFYMWLVANGADINAQNNYGCTCLFYIQNIKLLEFFISNGADLTIGRKKIWLLPDNCVEFINFIMKSKYATSINFESGITIGCIGFTQSLSDIINIAYKGRDLEFFQLLSEKYDKFVPSTITNISERKYSTFKMEILQMFSEKGFSLEEIDPSIHNLELLISIERKKVQKLEEENKAMRNHIESQPDGKVFLEAFVDFEERR